MKIMFNTINNKTSKISRCILVNILGAIVLASCTESGTNKQIGFPCIQEKHFDEPAGQVIINNPSDSVLNIRFQVNNQFWFTQNEILESVDQVQTDSLPGVPMDAAKAWTFIMDNTFHYQEIHLPKAFSYKPAILLNSFGGALCSHRNAALAQIWKWQGYESRCIHLEGHVVPELYYKDKWMMLDADYNCYFLNDDGDIADCKALENNISDFTQNKNPDSESIMHTLLRICPETYHGLFLSTKNNNINHWFIENIPEMPLHMTLPPGAQIKFPHITDNKAQTAHHFGILKIPGFFTGNLDIPFALYAAKADIIRSQNLHFQQNRINQPGTYFISGKDIEIVFLVNPVLHDRKIRSAKIAKNKDIELSITSGMDEPSSNRFLMFRKHMSHSFDSVFLSYVTDKSNHPEKASIEDKNDFLITYAEFMKIDSCAVPDSIRKKV
ncbi:MAG: hypothetical protein R6V32_12270, partial [Bacteroidales bacterium]